MKDLKNKLLGEPANFTFEHRILNFILILAIFMSYLGALLDILMWEFRMFWFLVGVIWIIMYFISRVQRYYKMISVISFTLLIYFFFPYNWLINAGSRGPFAYYALIFIVIMGTILKDRSQNILIFSQVGVVVVLLLVEYYFPDLIVNYADETMRYLDNSIHLMITMFVASVLIIVYSSTYRREKEKSDQYAKDIKEHYQQQLYYMKNLEELIYKLKAGRHDFNHRLGVIYGLLEEGEIDRLKSYTKKMVERTEEFQNIVNLPYPVIRAMLNYKLSSAREQEIDLNINIDIPPELTLNEFDITIILGNLLDNAVKACREVTEEKRYLNLNLEYNPDYLVITIKNPVVEKVNLEKKRNAAGRKTDHSHGFGLNNIEHLVKKHKGFMKIEQGNNTFTVKIALQLKTTY